jgi:hypothetical protein
MRRSSWEFKLAASLVIASALLYTFHYVIFHDMHHIFIYMVGDVAFVPIEVLLVTLLIHRLLERRERERKLEKLNIVIGTFFSEVGTQLLTYFSDHDPHLEDIKSHLIVDTDWDEASFTQATQALDTYSYDINEGTIELRPVHDLLMEERDFLVRVLENPLLLEHERFTELMQAVFHLAEELEHRKDLASLPASDRAHLALDMKRVYTRLASQWLSYMRHLKDHYPYLFSLAMRTNPFDENATASVA